MIYLKDLIRISTASLSCLYPEREAREMVFILLERLLGTQRYTHIIEPLAVVPDEKAETVEKACARLAGGEPLQYVIGTASFYGRDFCVSPSVLIPRPETEMLCRMALEALNSRSARILDMCTGSGCIAWTMALESPHSEVTAVDISEAALEIARSQDFSEEMGRTGAVAPVFVKADVLDEPLIFEENGSGKNLFDMILSNPPYVMDKEKAFMRSNVLDHEPHLALFVSDDDPLVFYRAVARWSERLLADGGIGMVEINEALGKETAEVFLDAGFKSAETVKDLSDRDRFVIFRK